MSNTNFCIIVAVDISCGFEIVARYHHQSMDRLPFDPDRVSKPAAIPAKAARRDRKRLANVADARQITVGQLSELIKDTLEQQIPSPLRVIGEVSNLSNRGHWYFSLKDELAVVSCVAWSSSAKKFGFTPCDGDEVVATGHVSHYSPQGRTQLYVTRLEPVGAGALELEFRRLCAELRDAGYFEPDHKIPTPIFPRRIAVITSKESAAVQDVIATAKQRCPAVGLLIVDVRVQGDGAAQQVANAIRWVDSNHVLLGVDAVLVTRGGGSIEDLWAFNERIVADAAFACELPLVAAIGHESDTTVIELVADARCATPTQAAVLLVPAAAELHKQIVHAHGRLQTLLQRRIETGQHRLVTIQRNEIFRRPELVLQRAAQRVDELSHRLRNATRQRLARRRIHIEQLAGRLSALGPGAIVSRQHQRLAVLTDRLERAVRHRIDQRSQIRTLHRELFTAHRHVLRHARQRITGFDARLIAADPLLVVQRGFSVTQLPDGSVVRSTGQITPGVRVTTRVADGQFDSVVDAHEKASTKQRPPSPMKPATRQSKRQPRDQMDLFAGDQ